MESKIQSFKDLDAWKEGHKLVISIYHVTENFPSKEQFSLINQMRRAVVSVTSNIAEGFSRQSYKDKVKFYSISLGSLTEVQNQFIISKDVGYINEKIFGETWNQTVKVHRIINGLIKSSKDVANSLRP